MEFDVLWAALHGVSAYAELLKTPVMEQSRALVGSLAQGRGTEALEAYTQLFHLLRREGYQGLGDWLWDGLRYVESPYGTLAERGDSDPALENAARREVETFLLLARMDCDRYVGELSNLLPPVYAPVLAGLPRWRRLPLLTLTALRRFTRRMAAACSPATGPLSGTAGS